MKAQVRATEEQPPLSAAFVPRLKQPYILICNICAGRAFQNGCSLEDDGRVCSNLRLGHWVLQRFSTDVGIHNVTLSSASMPREDYFKEGYYVFFFFLYLHLSMLHRPA